MNERTRAGGRNLFLLELVISILIFSLASAVCVQIFAQSHLRSRESRQLDLAVNRVSCAYELIAASRDEAEACELLCGEFPGLALAESGGVFSGETTLSDGFTLSVRLTREGQMLLGELRALGDGGNVLYSLPVEHHLQRGNSHER